MNKTKIVFIICMIMYTYVSFAQKLEYYNGAQIESNYVIIKFKPVTLKSAVIPSQSSTNLLDNFLESIDATKPVQKFPSYKMPDSCKKCVDIGLIYDFRFSGEIPMSKVLAYIRSLPNIEYAEPNYVAEALFVPNDTDAPTQWHMNTCKVYQAWDIEDGDTSVVIGVTDAGFDIDNIEIVEQIKYNYGDPINGFDDDYDGFVDNFRGWDFGSNDNNPANPSTINADQDHGTIVAGLASAKVDNSFGISGTGYKCKFLPVKIANDSRILLRTYEGLVYAANHDCDIINCSWGSLGAYSQYGQDIVNYATFNCNSLVVASAGNSHNMGVYYPASYENALSIAGTVSGDQKWSANNSLSKSGSNWGYFVDVCAPAAAYRAITKGNVTTYVYGGTSFSAPIVSGIAGLVKSKYPADSALKIGERIRATCDNIYAVEYNEPYIDLLGSGRVNALKALKDTVIPSVRMVDFSYVNPTGQYMFYTGDTLELTITFKNYLAKATNLFISISCESSILAPLNSNILFPTINAGEEFTLTVPFTFKIVATLPPDFSTLLKISYTAAGNYSGFEYMPISFNPSYYDFEIGNFKATATADGSIGVFNPYNKKEYGIIYSNYPNMLYEASLMIGQADSLVVSTIQNNRDYGIKQFPTIVDVDSADLLIYSKFEVSELNLLVDQYEYAWNDKDVLMYEYSITNNTDSTIHNLKVGPYLDWALLSQDYNKVAYVDSLQLAVISTIDPSGFYTGIMPLHYHKSNLYAIDDEPDLDSIYTEDGFTDEEMWYVLTNEKNIAGNRFQGANVATVSSAIIGEIESGKSGTVRYAIISGNSFDQVANTAINLKKNYVTDTSTAIIDTLGVSHLQTNNVTITNNNDFVTIKYQINSKPLKASLLNIQGKVLTQNVVPSSEQKGILQLPISQYAQGVYLLQIDYLNESSMYKILIVE